MTNNEDPHQQGPLAHFAFPRTGKRGVPQQFPRRLYEMLDGEAKVLDANPKYKAAIAWSESGKAFRIFDVTEFAASVLPKYFRTKKFSSFQRNLNLYGFTKIRRGVDSDMYSHPSFIRDHPESLLNLRKTTAAARRRLVSDASAALVTTFTPMNRNVGTVSPPTTTVTLPTAEAITAPANMTMTSPKNKILLHGFNAATTWTTTIRHQQQQATPVSPSPPTSTRSDHSDGGSTGSHNDRGKLDLLAFCVEQEFANRRHY